KVLEREELIKSERDGIFKRFYPIEERVPANLMHVSRIQEKILNEIIDRPGITQMGLAKRLEVSHQVVNYHIKKLVSSRLVKAERLGKKTKYYPIEDQGLIK
ncbi:MAG: MarR family transcriptional regulator, partial [Thermoplasmata archaeon]|nr:MarR family transcriptional regulator [Thermoplasmata archaeon]